MSYNPEKQMVKISEVCYVFDGPHATPTKTEDGPVYLGIDALTTDGRINPEGYNHLSEEDLIKWTKRVTPMPGDVVFSYEATLGRYAIIPEDFYGCLGRRIALLRVKDKRINPKWLLYYFLSPEWQKFIDSKTVIGSTVNRIAIKEFPDYEIPLIPRVTQDKIVAVLSALDDKADVDKKIINNLQKRADELFRGTFITFECLDNSIMIDSDLGLVPAGWKVLSLGDVTKNMRKKVQDQSLRVLSAVNSGRLKPSDEYFSKQVFSKDISNYLVVEENDFAYNPARVNIGSIGMNDLGYTGCVSPVYVVFRAEEGYHNYFKFFIKTKRFADEVQLRSFGSVRQSMNYSDFAQIMIAYPPKSVMQSFDNQYQTILHDQLIYETEMKKILEMKELLLPALISGDLDVSRVNL